MHKLTVTLACTMTLLLISAPAALASSERIYQRTTPCRDIALTYDAEFSPTTQSLVNVLDDLDVRTTWFLLGNQVERYPALVRQIAARHQIGNHSYTHPEMSRLSAEAQRAEIRSADRAIARVTGRPSLPLFRPPYGAWNQTLLNVAEELGYRYTLLWSVDTEDWTGRPAEEIRQHILTHASPGAIVLMHGSPANTAEATRRVIPDLRARGYQFVTVTELMGLDRGQRDFGGDHYVVQQGDTWAQIGACHNLTGPRMAAYNEAEHTTPTPGATLSVPHRDEVIIRLNGERANLPAYPRIVGDRVVAHVRLVETLGAEVTWDGNHVRIRYGGKETVITPGDRIARVDGVAADMGAPATWAGDRILVPVRFLAEQFGAKVDWQADTWTVTISQTTA